MFTYYTTRTYGSTRSTLTVVTEGSKEPGGAWDQVWEIGREDAVQRFGAGAVEAQEVKCAEAVLKGAAGNSVVAWARSAVEGQPKCFGAGFGFTAGVYGHVEIWSALKAANPTVHQLVEWGWKVFSQDKYDYLSPEEVQGLPFLGRRVSEAL